MKANFETGLKVCSHCKRELPLSMFPKALSSPDGLYCQCKECKKSQILDGEEVKRDEVIQVVNR